MANELKHGDQGCSLTKAEFEGVGLHVFDSQATGDLPYASSASQISRLGIGSSNALLEVASGIPGWTTSPTIGATAWANANHAHAASNSGGTIAITATTGTLAVGNGGTGSTTACAARTALGLAIGTNVQAYDAGLTSIAGLTTAADKMIYTSGSDTYAVADLSSFARTVLDDADAGAVRTTLGLVIGTNVQAYDADLAALAGLSSSDSNFIVGSASGWVAESGSTARTSLGLGSLATASNVNNCNWSGADLSVANGGTGASTFTANGVLLGNGTSAISAVDMSTKGHILIGDGSGNPQMLAVGSNSQVLTACSGETTGVKWAAASGGGGVSLSGSTNNTITTVTGACAIQGEDKLTYDGTDFVVQQCGGSATGSSIISRNYNDGGNPARVRMQTSRNDSASHTAVTNGTPLGFVQFEGSDGSAFQRGAYIEATAGATWSGSNRQSYLSWYVTPSGCSTSNTLSMRLTSDGQLRLKDGQVAAPSLSFNCDTNTGMYSYAADEIGFATGGTRRVVMDNYGMIHLNDDANPSMTIGYNVCQGTADNSFFSAGSSDVSHSTTSFQAANFFLKMTKVDGARGGLFLCAITESGNARAIVMRGTSADSGSSLKSASGVGVINFEFGKACGTGAGNMTGGTNGVAMSEGGSARWLLCEDGDVFYAGTTNASHWDQYCDVKLLTATRAVLMEEGADFRNRFSGFINDYSCVLEKTGVVHLNRDTDGRPFVSTKGLNGLIIDAIRQVHETVSETRNELSDLQNRFKALEGGDNGRYI